MAKQDSASGQQTKRQQRGQQTRERILDATLELIAAEGIAAVTHRAVAARAGVQHSLTTYYFKDLMQLLTEAFEKFAQRGRPELEQTWTRLFDYLDQFSEAELASDSIREEVHVTLADAASDYVSAQLRKRKGGLAVEQSFLLYARRNKAMRPVANAHLRSLREPITRLCSYFNTHDPEVDAELLLGALMRLEYEASSGLAGRDENQRRTLLARQLAWIMGLQGTAVRQ
ncbi:MAG: TetR family transcriptional regulator [Pseudomonadota bacterium]